MPAPMPNAITIAAANAEDLAAVARLADEVWRSHYPGILSAEQIDYMLAQGYAREALMKFVTEPHAGLALARRDADVAGFAAWYLPRGGGAMKLDKLYVLPRHHGAGVGRALIEHVVTRARAAGCGAVTLNVNRGNASAIRAYERCGFSIRDRGDFPIGNGFVMEDFIMARDL
jgi:ribosomal protein S18 acetylase RimI-like enzyme